MQAMLRIPRRLKSTLRGKKFDAVVIGGGHNGLVAVSITQKKRRERERETEVISCNYHRLPTLARQARVWQYWRDGTCWVVLQ